MICIYTHIYIHNNNDNPTTNTTTNNNMITIINITMALREDDRVLPRSLHPSGGAAYDILM